MSPRHVLIRLGHCVRTNQIELVSNNWLSTHRFVPKDNQSEIAKTKTAKDCSKNISLVKTEGECWQNKK